MQILTYDDVATSLGSTQIQQGHPLFRHSSLSGLVVALQENSKSQQEGDGALVRNSGYVESKPNMYALDPVSKRIAKYHSLLNPKLERR